MWSPCVGKQSSGKRGAIFTISWCYCHNRGQIASWLTQHKSVRIPFFTWCGIRCCNAGALRWTAFFLPLSVRWHHRWSMFYKKLTLVGKRVLNKADMWKRLMNLMSIASFFSKKTFAFKSPHNTQSHQMGNVIDDGIFCTWWTLWSLMKCVCLHILSGKSCFLWMNRWMDSKAPAGWVSQWLSSSWRVQIDRSVHWGLFTLIQCFSHGYMGRNDSQTKHTNQKKIQTKATTRWARRCRTSLSVGRFSLSAAVGWCTQCPQHPHRLETVSTG